RSVLDSMHPTKLAILASLSAAAFAQTPVPPAAKPAFEVASIRPASPTPPEQVTVGVHLDGAQFRAAYLTLRDYIITAYQVKPYPISGPDWINSDRFDIAARLTEGSEISQVGSMMQALLEERFQLKTHREKKEFPVYVLEVAKGGLKIQESAPNAEFDNA